MSDENRIDQEVMQETEVTEQDNDLVRVISYHSTEASGEPSLSVRPPQRTTSHSLLSATNAAYGQRKGQQVSVEQTAVVVEKASISMPPPSFKPPMHDRRLSASNKMRRSEENESSARDSTCKYRKSRKAAIRTHPFVVSK